MKIAIVRKKYNPFGGAERYIHLLSTHLVREGHEVHLFANQWPAGQDGGVIFHRIPMIGGLSLLKVWSFALAAWVVLRRFDADVIFSNERLFVQDIFRASDGVHRTWLHIRMRHASVVKKLSLAINPLHWSVRFFDWYILNQRAFRKIIAPSDFIKRDILQTYPHVREEDIHVIYNGVDLDRFHPGNKSRYRDMTRKELGISETDRLLLFVGTGFERKGLRYAVESLRYLPDNIFLAVIGKGRTQFYKTLAEEIGVQKRIRFLGPVEGVERYYAAADILISPTLYEPMANVILEALATGIPVVTSRDCGNAEVITDGEDGWIINDPADPREISLRIKTAMEKARDQEMERRTRKKAEQFTLQRTIGEITDLITSAVKTR
ncbi:MAG: glycosyltransferase family 4 protein [Nitrospirae bacterium]|nr:glycosyltransferase family 4 protein [Nitrospirota bacterium]